MIRKRTRKMLSSFLRKMPLTSELCGPPKKFSATTADWVENNKKRNGSRYLKHRPEEMVRRPKTKTIGGEIDERFLQPTVISPPTFLAEIGGGRLFGKHGFVITPDDILLADVSREFPTKSPDQFAIMSRLKLPSLQKVRGSVAVIAGPHGDNYYHWMFDTLPRLKILADLKIIPDKLVVRNVKTFQKESLDQLGITEKDIIPATDRLHIRAENLFVPSLPGISGSMPRWACEFLREKFLPLADADPKRVFISRRNTSRNLENEEEIIALLKTFDFQAIQAEKLSFRDQVNLFSSAEVIVAPHGAGLTNVVFAEPGTKVLEIFSPGHSILCYFYLAGQAQLKYHYLFGEFRNGRSNPTADFHVRLDVIEEMIRKMLN